MKKKINFPVTIAFRIDSDDKRKLEQTISKQSITRSEFLRKHLINHVINFEK